jgi:hypothetical protein
MSLIMLRISGKGYKCQRPDIMHTQVMSRKEFPPSSEALLEQPRLSATYRTPDYLREIKAH